MSRGGAVFGQYMVKPRDGRASYYLTDNEVKTVCETYRAGNSIEKTARLCGTSRTLTERILNEQQEPIRKKGWTVQRREESHLDTWINRQLRAPEMTLLERRRAGATFKDLAKLYGCNPQHISAHVDELEKRREQRMKEGMAA